MFGLPFFFFCDCGRMRTDDAGSGEFRYHDDDWKGYRRRKKEDKEEKEREESDKIFGSNLSDDARAHQQSDYGPLEAFPFFSLFLLTQTATSMASLRRHRKKDIRELNEIVTHARACGPGECFPSLLISLSLIRENESPRL